MYFLFILGLNMASINHMYPYSEAFSNEYPSSDAPDSLHQQSALCKIEKDDSHGTQMLGSFDKSLDADVGYELQQNKSDGQCSFFDDVFAQITTNTDDVAENSDQKGNTVFSDSDTHADPIRPNITHEVVPDMTLTPPYTSGDVESFQFSFLESLDQTSTHPQSCDDSGVVNSDDTPPPTPCDIDAFVAGLTNCYHENTKSQVYGAETDESCSK